MVSKIIVHPDLETRAKKINELLTQAGFKTLHPDVLIFEDTQKLGVEQAKQITQFFSLKPYQAKGRAVVVYSGHNLNISAQNMLLKTIEELNNYSVILIGSMNPSVFLPTIISRCEVVTLSFSNTYELDEKAKKDIEKLEKSSIKDRFLFIEKLTDRENFLQSLIIYYRGKLHKDLSYLEFNKKLIEAQEYVKANVNTRAVLEYLMFNLPKKIQ